jgi:hypothetical protein
MKECWFPGVQLPKPQAINHESLFASFPSEKEALTSFPESKRALHDVQRPPASEPQCAPNLGPARIS